MTIEHSSGCRDSHTPLSDQEQTIAIVLDVLKCGSVDDDGTDRYGPCDAESEGARVVAARRGNDEGGRDLKGRREVAAVTGSNGVGASPLSDTGSSDVSEDEDEIDSSESDSEEESDVIEGAYSCFRGEEDHLLVVLFSEKIDSPSWVKARSFDEFLHCKLAGPCGGGTGFWGSSTEEFWDKLPNLPACGGRGGTSSVKGVP